MYTLSVSTYRTMHGMASSQKAGLETSESPVSLLIALSPNLGHHQGPTILPLKCLWAGLPLSPSTIALVHAFTIFHQE